MPVDKFGRMSDTKTKDTGVSLTYINNNYIRSDGGTPITGSIDMKGNTLFNVSDPVNPQDVATKEYADNNKRKHVIAVNSNYVGPLHKGHFQFSFGGTGETSFVHPLPYPEYQKMNRNGSPGFVIPHSGQIKKVTMKTPLSKYVLGKYLVLRERSDLEYTGDSFFSFVNMTSFGIDSSAIEIKVGTIKCREAYKLYFKKDDEKDDEKNEKYFIGYDFCFDDDLPLDYPRVYKGDVINILTEIDLELPSMKELYNILGREEERHTYPYSGFEGVFFKNVYMVTILIELDPL